MTGYLHPLYAESLREFGTPYVLSRCGGRILVRWIPGVRYRDAMGCYPLFACRDWSNLHRDLENIGDELISLSLVTDPFGDYDESYLRRCFPEVTRPFKKHFVVDLRLSLETTVSRHHRRNVRKAFKDVEIEKCQDPVQFLDDWVDLYATLARRHDLKGIQAFSREAFRKQLQVPGIVSFRAVNRGHTIGMLLWYIQEEVAYYHLGAYDRAGYQLRASFALFWCAIEYFSSMGNLRWLNLGAGSGVSDSGDDGLSRFKRGWATATRTAYFCGRIFDKERYAEVTNASPRSFHGYFPEYREGEFV